MQMRHFLKDCVSPHCNILIAEHITLVDFSLRILPLILSLSLSINNVLSPT